MAQRHCKHDDSRPRKNLGWSTPAEAMADEIAAFKSTVVLDV
jgi:IS30 family transposase